MALPVLVLRNGELIPPAQADISVFNPALSGAFGVYESLQVVRGKAFAVDAHLERLLRSSALIELPLPAGRDTFKQWIQQVVAANEAEDCVLRIVAVGPENGGAATAFLWPQPAAFYPETLYRDGAAVITFHGQRFLPMAKSLNGLVTFLARRKAQQMGAHEALLYHQGWFTEGSNSNLFAVLEGVLVTPPAGQVLSGVSRDIVLHLAAQHEIPVREAALDVDALPRWRECFITSTSRHIMPVTTVDGRPVGGGQVGPLTRRLMDLFAEVFAEATR